MTWSQFLLDYDEWWATLTFILAVVFILYYGLSLPWWKTPFGQMMIMMDLGLAVATFPTAMYFMFGVDLTNKIGLIWVTIILGALIPLAILYRIATLWAVHQSKLWKRIRGK